MFGSPRTLKNSAMAPAPTPASAMSHGSALSQLQPAQVRTLREGFQILDRDSDGVVNREDVADMLNQLGESLSSYPLCYCGLESEHWLIHCLGPKRSAIHSQRRRPLLPSLRSANNDPCRLPQYHRHNPCLPVAKRRATLGLLCLRR